MNPKLVLRRLGRQKINTTLHIVGLTLGMSVCLLIGLFLRYELTFDAYHDKTGRTYRINSVWIDAGKKSYHYSTPMPLAEALRSGVTGLENVTLAHPQQRSMIEIHPAKRFIQDKVLITDPEFLDIFKVDMLEGNGHDALRKPYQALLTETTAKKFFGKEDPIGKTFRFKDKFIITVAGLIRDLPTNTHLPFSMLLSYVPDEKFLMSGPNAWSYVSGTSTYVVLPEGYDLKTLDAALKAIADKNINADPRLPKFSRSYFDIQSLHDVHFDSKYAGGGEWVKAVNTSWLWFFAIIGLAVLVLACINFVNLSTAQAITRAKEVGVRKSIGAGKIHLMTQFLAEAGMLAFFSGILSVAIAQSVLPAVNSLLEKGITFQLMQSTGLLLSLLTGVVFTTLLAGLYPAWVIAKFNPAATLKVSSTVAADGGTSWLRKGLVVTQFTISAGLLIAVALIAQQVNFLRSKNLGFDHDNIINVETRDAGKAPVFASELNKIPQVKDVSFATATPSNEGHWGTLMSLTNGDDPHRQQVTLIMGDDHYCKLYGLKLLSGRFLIATDTNSTSRSIPQAKQVAKVVVNETLVKSLGFASNEVALASRFWFGMGSGYAEIVGVVADFNTSSLHEAIKPALITQDPSTFSQAGIKIEAGSNLPETITAIEAAWKKAYPDGIFEFKFLDDQLDNFYKAEARLYNLFKIFAGLAMLISCLGLWGLAAFAAQQRTKEIGIRKVLGATANGIVVLLSKDFLLLVMIALAISSPLAYYGMNYWLQNFAFRIEIGWNVFVIVGTVSLLLALLTVSFQALKAAWANPVESLRTE